jgi:hypothetical protein
MRDGLTGGIDFGDCGAEAWKALADEDKNLFETLENMVYGILIREEYGERYALTLGVNWNRLCGQVI